MDEMQPTQATSAPYRSSVIIFSVALVVCAWMISGSIENYGKSVEKAAQSQRVTSPSSIHIPSNITLRLESGNNPIRIQNQ